jgi:hypothetical protein
VFVCSLPTPYHFPLYVRFRLAEICSDRDVNGVYSDSFRLTRQNGTMYVIRLALSLTTSCFCQLSGGDEYFP